MGWTLSNSCSMVLQKINENGAVLGKRRCGEPSVARGASGKTPVTFCFKHAKGFQKFGGASCIRLVDLDG